MVSWGPFTVEPTSLDRCWNATQNPFPLQLRPLQAVHNPVVVVGEGDQMRENKERVWLSKRQRGRSLHSVSVQYPDGRSAMSGFLFLAQTSVQNDTVQVELVNESPWWADPLPWLAIVISVLTLLWTIYDRKRGAAKLRVGDFSFRPNGEVLAVQMPAVTFRIEDKGFVQATEISSIQCGVPDYYLRRYGGDLTIQLEITRPLPFKVEPGAGLEVRLNHKQILWALEPGVHVGQRWRRRRQLRRAWIDIASGHGVTRQRFDRFARDVLSEGGQRFDNVDIPGFPKVSRDSSRKRHPSQIQG